MTKKITWILMCLSLALSMAALAQTAESTRTPESTQTPPSGWSNDDPPVWLLPNKPPLLYQGETSEERMKRIGLDEDPGLEPDPDRVWVRGGRKHTIARFERYYAYYRGQRRGWVQPYGWVNLPSEIYREDDKYVWVWLDVVKEKPQAAPQAPPQASPAEDPEEEVSPEEPEVDPALGEQSTKPANNRNWVEVTPEIRAYLENLKKEFVEVSVPSSGVTLGFREASEGLPTRGSWRNGMDVADMNGDGHLDIIVPPQRGGSTFPAIFLGGADGRWTPWQEARWPGGWNYGTVKAGDLNGDGKMDLVGGAHVMTVYALLGDGKGTFTKAIEGLPVRFPTRRVELADADGDGDLDIFAITEGPTMGTSSGLGSRLRLFKNDGAAKWTEVQISEPVRQVGGDWLTVGDFNGDGRADVAGSSIFFSGTDLVYLQQQGGGWGPFGRGFLPFRSYYAALANGDFTRAKGTDLILTYKRSWTGRLREEDFQKPPAPTVIGIERVTWDGKGRATRHPIVSWGGERPIWGIATGDFNRDGKKDLVYSASNPRRLEFLLGDGKGGFRTASAEGIELPDRTLYEITVRDVNRDGRDDILLMFEKSERLSNGSIQVWLGQ